MAGGDDEDAGGIDWTSGTPHEAVVTHARWVKAIEAADAGDSEPLDTLIRNERVPSPEIQNYIDDLRARALRRGKRGRPRTPTYRTTPAEAEIETIYGRYKGFKNPKREDAPKLTKDEAMQEALRAHKREQMRLARDRLQYLEQILRQLRGDNILEELRRARENPVFLKKLRLALYDPQALKELKRDYGLHLEHDYCKCLDELIDYSTSSIIPSDKTIDWYLITDADSQALANRVNFRRASSRVVAGRRAVRRK